jgi:ATP-binding cassette subfamily F protein 3
MGEIWGRLIEIDSDAAPAKASEILVGLGFTQEDLARPMAEFSGGWRMRVALAAALFAEPDMLLLDEPTNYLDLEGALWLEARLQKYPHTALIVSHDRELLNNSCTHMLHLAGGKLELYTGGYDDFEKRRAEKARLQLSAKAKQDAERAHLQAFVDRFKAKASKAAQAQSRMKRLAKMEPVATTIEERVAPFTLPSPPRPLPPPLIRLERANVGYEEGRSILKNLNLRMDLDDRIGLLGVNGAGKSTFAKMIAGALTACSRANCIATARCGSAGSTSTRSRRWIPTTPRWRSSAGPCRTPRNPRAARNWRSSASASTSRRPRSPTCRAASAPACCSTWWRWTRRTC